MKRGYFGIGIFDYRHEHNAGTLFRSAMAFGANYIFTIGRKYKVQSSDTCRSVDHVPCFNYETKEDFIKNIPLGCRLVIAELHNKAHSLPNFCHPEKACYLLGSEGGGLPPEWLDKYMVTQIPGRLCLNVAVAGSLLLYDRVAKMGVQRP